MITEVIAVDAQAPDPSAILRAAQILRRGGLVAFPTETVYGLGANALDASAVERIFAAKGRPARNPLIVHVADVASAKALVQEWPESAQQLAERFWPGPLTMVLKKNECIVDLATAGGDTVALRVPAHPVASALLRTCALPLAAPSANRSTTISPTRGEHVLRTLQGRFELLLDAGPTAGGLESTVLDLTTNPPRLLRPGLVGRPELEAVVGPIDHETGRTGKEDEPLRSPGLLDRHYAPATPLETVDGDGLPRVSALARQGLRVGWLTFAAPSGLPASVTVATMPDRPGLYAAQLYETLHRLDAAAFDCIIVDLPPATEAWTAVRDRLGRARSRRGL